MRLRLVVVAAFVAMAVVPAFFAYSTGVLPGPTQASAESSGATTSAAHPVGSLAWPKDALGLTATDTAVLWEQRDPSAAVAGLWSYDVRTQATDRVLGRAATGKSGGFPSASGDVIAWAAWAGRRGAGPPRSRPTTSLSTRRWTVARGGPRPLGRRRQRHLGRGRRGRRQRRHPRQQLADRRGVLDHRRRQRPRRRRVGQLGRLDRGARQDGRRVGRLLPRRRPGTSSPPRAPRSRSTATGSSGPRPWAATRRAIVSWDRHSRHSTVLCRVAGTVSSLVLSRRYAAWVTTRDKTGPQVWAYDFDAGKAYHGQRREQPPGQPRDRRRQRVLGRRPQRALGAVRQVPAAVTPAPARPPAGAAALLV